VEGIFRNDRKPVDPPQFVRLFLENERRIYAFILSVLPSLNDAQDVLQDTSLVLWQKFDQYEPGTNFFAWASQIARFEVLKFYKKQRRSHLWLSQAVVDTIAEKSVANAPLLDARYQALADCMQKLNPRDRDLLERRYGKVASPQEVASQVGRSIDAVYKALKRIQDALMLCIQQKLKQEHA
jgi:RNA polymerase sigma-70 factor, ECF subfamily